jgi:hypothetical protein
MAADPNRSGSLRDAARAALAAQDKAPAKETQNRQTQQAPAPKQQPLASQQPMTGGNVAQSEFALEMNKRYNAALKKRSEEKKQQGQSQQPEKQYKAQRPDHAALKKEPARTPEKEQQAAAKTQEAKKRPMTFNCFHDPDHGRGR